MESTVTDLDLMVEYMKQIKATGKTKDKLQSENKTKVLADAIADFSAGMKNFKLEAKPSPNNSHTLKHLVAWFDNAAAKCVGLALQEPHPAILFTCGLAEQGLHFSQLISPAFASRVFPVVQQTCRDLGLTDRSKHDWLDIPENPGLGDEQEPVESASMTSTLIRKGTANATDTPNVWNKHYVTVQVREPDGLFYPVDNPKEIKVTRLHMSIQGGNQDPHLLLKSRIESNRPRVPAREARVEFCNSGDNHAQRGFKDLQIGEIYKAEDKSTPRYMEISFEGIAEGISCAAIDFADNPDFSPDARHVLKILQRISKGGPVHILCSSTSTARETDTPKTNLANFANEIMIKDRPYPLAAYHSVDKKRALTIQSQMASRQRVNAIHPIVNHRSRYHFKNPKEGAIAFCYGLATSQLYEKELYLKLNPTNVPFISLVAISDQHVIGLLVCNVEAMLDENGRWVSFPSTNSDSVIVSFRVPDDRSTKPKQVKGIILPELIANEDYTMSFLCTPIPSEVASFATAPDQPRKWMPITRISVDQQFNTIENQIRAINTLISEPELAHFIPLFLNQRPESLPFVDPTESIEHLDEFERREHMLTILGQGDMTSRLGNRSFSTQQKAPILNFFRMRGGIQIFDGPGGSGKTTTMCAQMALQLNCGGRVIVTAATHMATGHICDKMNVFLRSLMESDPDMAPLQVGRQCHEENHFKQCGKVPSGRPIAQLAENGIDVNQLAKENPDLISMFNVIKDQRSTKPFAHPERGLASRALHLVHCRPRPYTAWTQYPAPQTMLPRFDEAKWSKADMWGPTPKERPSPVDMFDECKKFLVKIQSSDDGLKCLNPLESKKFDHAMRHVFREVMSRAKVIVSTLDNVINDIITPTVLKDSQSAVLFVDEAAMATEPQIWAAVTKLVAVERVREEFGGKWPIRGIVLSGDYRQSWPQDHSEPYNEWSNQLTYPLMARLLESGFPVYKFSQQMRQHPGVFRLAYARSYFGTVTTNLALDTCMTKKQDHRLRTWIYDGITPLPRPKIGTRGETDDDSCRTKQDHYLRTILIDVPNSRVDPQLGYSKTNEANVKVALKLLHDLWFNPPDGVPFTSFKEVVVLAPYKHQVNLYRRAFNNIARARGIHPREMPEVCTGDSFQSREVDAIVFDAVVTSTASRKDLGFMDDDKRMTVLMTRARKFMFIIAKGQMTDTRQYHQAQDPLRLPYIGWVVQKLQKDGYVKVLDVNYQPHMTRAVSVFPFSNCNGNTNHLDSPDYAASISHASLLVLCILVWSGKARMTRSL